MQVTDLKLSMDNLKKIAEIMGSGTPVPHSIPTSLATC